MQTTQGTPCDDANLPAAGQTEAQQDNVAIPTPNSNPWRPIVTPSPAEGGIQSTAFPTLLESSNQTNTTMNAGAPEAPTDTNETVEPRQDTSQRAKSSAAQAVEPAGQTNKNKKKKKKKEQAQAEMGKGNPPLGKVLIEETPRLTDRTTSVKRRRVEGDVGKEGEPAVTIRAQNAAREESSHTGDPDHHNDLTPDITNLTPPPADGYYSDGGVSYADTDTDADRAMEVDTEADHMPEVEPRTPRPGERFTFRAPPPQLDPFGGRGTTALHVYPTLYLNQRGPAAPGPVPTTPQTPTPTNLRDLHFSRI
ncbi:hypothetical protein EVJ58_g8914 [Rhodofomes roseus]|uniref:Uncharacterized protein n=1 Tax=Rhodofomes roseus TaxID=34475 RepID=A0A4Y9XW55_9APHY|nr:hypothetical protein EVJ58_g8914 [Rhodofomes roseus]